MLKKTKLMTIDIHIFNSTYTISCVIVVHPVLISIDHRSRAALDNRTEGGGGSQYQVSYTSPGAPGTLFFLIS